MAILFSLLGAPVPDSLGGFDLGTMSEERDGA
jgi:hypothetical protein